MLRRLFRLLLLLVLVVIVVGGLFRVFSRTKTHSFTVQQPIRKVDVTSSAGSIRVRGSDRSTTRVEWKGRYAPRSPNVTRRVRGDTLVVRAHCPTLSVCTVSYRISVPSGTRITATSRAGDVTVDSVAGELDLRTRAGSIDVAGGRDAVRARTNAGAINGRRLGMGRLTAESNAGNITAVFRSPADRAELSTNAGNVTVELPEGAYRVDARTNAGSRDVQVKNTPGASHVIVAHTNAGNVHVRRGGAR